MKLCLFQPQSFYPVQPHFKALAKTFPQLVADLDLDESNYCVYVRGISQEILSEYISREKVTHFLISSITATFPDAINAAEEAKAAGCITVVGGIFPSTNAETIQRHFSCFDFIVVGMPTRSLLSNILSAQQFPSILYYPRHYNINAIFLKHAHSRHFKNVFKDDPLCYEITNGCVHDCSFCTLRAAWGTGVLHTRNMSLVKQELNEISKTWRKLKIIDDDILQRRKFLSELSLYGQFDQVIVETRVDRLTKKSVAQLKSFGVTHVLFGVETLDEALLKSINKSQDPRGWEKRVFDAIDLCRSAKIVARPVVMLTAPDMSTAYLSDLVRKIRDWKPRNGVEILFAFYTVHPGCARDRNDGVYLTNDLSKFDHLHLVFLPRGYQRVAIPTILELYQLLVNETESSTFNPPVEETEIVVDRFKCFIQP